MASAAHAFPSAPHDAAAGAIDEILRSSLYPTLCEPGLPPFSIEDDNLQLSRQARTLLVEIHDQHRVLSRRVTGIARRAPGRLELTTERFGGKKGTLLLYDAGRVSNQPLEHKTGQWSARDAFARLLERRFPGWTVDRLSSGAHHEHSLSALYPRAAIRRGQQCYAALAVPTPATDAAHALTYGLIWLDYLRQNGHVNGLALFVPPDAIPAMSIRLALLNDTLAKFRLFAWDTETGACSEADCADNGNVQTHLDLPGFPAPRLTPESLLESSIHHQITHLDPTLLPRPVYRQLAGTAGRQEGILDLLAIDREHRLALIELKASPSIHLPVQALDYFIRTRWQLERGEFERAGLFPDTPIARQAPRVLLAAPALAFHPSNDTVLSFFHPDIAIERIGLASDSWASTPRVLFRDTPQTAGQSSNRRGKSSPSSRERARSASTRPPVWQRAQ
jgi:hypothetical protein